VYLRGAVDACRFIERMVDAGERRQVDDTVDNSSKVEKNRVARNPDPVIRREEVPEILLKVCMVASYAYSCTFRLTV
jgi:hypothetical protein